MGGGTLGLVHDLNIKLQKQQKVLRSLIKDVKAQESAEWQCVQAQETPAHARLPVCLYGRRALHSWHFIVVVIISDILITILGFTASSALLGISPSGGSIATSKMHSTGLTVVGGARQDVIVESARSNSEMSIVSSTKSSLVLENTINRNRNIEISSDGSQQFDMRMNEKQMLHIGGNGTITDVKLFTPLSSYVNINDNLQLSHNRILAQNTSLTLEPSRGRDVWFMTHGGGRTAVGGEVYLSGNLKVGLPSQTHVLFARTVVSTVNYMTTSRGYLDLGTTAEPTTLSVWGSIIVSSKTTIVGNVRLKDGSMKLGKANVICGTRTVPGSLGVGGDTTLGSSVNNTVLIMSTLHTMNDKDIQTTFDPNSGSLTTKGSLIVDQTANLQSSVQLGGKASDSVTVHAALTTARSVNASSHSVLGTRSSDNMDVYGSLVLAHNNAPMFGVEQASGDIESNTDLSVAQTSNFAANVILGSPHIPGREVLNDTSSTSPGSLPMLTAHGETEFSAPVVVNGSMITHGDARLASFAVKEKNVNLNHKLSIFNGSDTLLTIASDTGNTRSAGNLDVRGRTKIEHDFETGLRSVNSAGEFHTKSTMSVMGGLTVAKNMQTDGDMHLTGSLTTTSNLTLDGDLYLGKLQSSNTAHMDNLKHILYGNLDVSDTRQASVFQVASTTGDVLLDGRLSVKGTSLLSGATTINSNVTLNGRGSFADIFVRKNSHFLGNETNVTNVEVSQNMHVQGNLAASANCSIASLSSEVHVRGTLHVLTTAGKQCLHVSESIAAVYGQFRAEGPAIFDDRVDLGSPTGDVHVFATFKATGPVNFNAATHAKKNLVAAGKVTTDGQFHAKSDITIGTGSQTLTIFGDLRFTAGTNARVASDVLTVKRNGEMTLTGTMAVGGDLVVGGRMQSVHFNAASILVDTVSGIKGTDRGVLIEDVLFRSGAIERVKVGNMVELISEKGVTIENVNSKAGALVLQSKKPGISPVGDWPIMILENKNHHLRMDNVSTSLLFRQFYHDTRGKHAPQDSAMIGVTTATSWTKSVSTLNSRMTWHTTEKGQLKERVRVTPVGDFEFSEEKLRMDGNTGNVNIQGNLSIGGKVAGNNTLQLLSATQKSTILVSAGGSANSMVRFNVATHQMSLSNVNSKTGLPVGALHLTDEANKKPILTLDVSGSLHVSGSITTGELDKRISQTLKMKSAGPATLAVESGISSDAKLVVTGGKNKNAELRLIDPADSVQGSTFVLANDGGQSNATLRLSDGTQTMLSVVDKGSVGNVIISGDLQVSARGNIPRVVRVSSAQSASVKLESGKDSSVHLTSGPDKDSKIVFTDSTMVAKKSGSTDIFEVTNVGIPAIINASTLAISKAGVPLMSIDDSGKFANMRVTGNGILGNEATAVPILCKVLSSNSSRLTLQSGKSSGATFTLRSKRSNTLTLDVLNSKSGSEKLTVNVSTGSNLAPISSSTDSLWSTKNPMFRVDSTKGVLLQLVDQGKYGDIAVQGNLMLSGIRKHRMTLASSLASATLSILSGPHNSSTITIQSKVDGSPEFNFDDLKENKPANFKLINEGHLNKSTLSIKDSLANNLMQIQSSNGTGNLFVTGDVQFGSTATTTDRTLTVLSAAHTDVVVTSGAKSHANLTIKAAKVTGKSSSLVFRSQNATSYDNSTGFELSRPVQSSGNKLQIKYSNHELLSLTDAGAVGNLHVTGSTTIGTMLSSRRTVLVNSSKRSFLAVKSGDFDDAVVSLESGPNRKCNVSIKTGPSGFELLLDGNQAQPKLTMVNAKQHTMMTVTDVGATGDVLISGDAIIGSTDSERTNVLRSSANKKATMDVQGNKAVLHIKGGGDPSKEKFAQLELATQPAVGKGSFFHDYFALRNEGRGVGAIGGRLSLRNAQSINDTVLEVNSDTKKGELRFTGSVSIEQTSKINVTVKSNGAATSTITGGDTAELRVQAGDNMDQTLVLSSLHKPDYVGQAVTYKTFNISNKGNPKVASKPELQISDGVSRLLTIHDEGATAVFNVTGKVVADRLQNDGNTQLGSSTVSQVQIKGHIVSSTLNFDADRDGTAFQLKFEDPAKFQQITMPAESGTVLTTTSKMSSLTIVGALSSGQIVEGFGKIHTSSSIETSSTILSQGTVTANGLFQANGDAYLGDSSADKLTLRGIVQTNLTFKDGYGAKITSDDGRKSSKIKASFLATSTDSPAGDRVIVIPDSPKGGMLHVVYRQPTNPQASNVHQVTNDATAGVILSAATDVDLGAMRSRKINLVNRRIGTKSTVIATVNQCNGCNTASPGQTPNGGWLMVSAIKLNQNGGGCTIIVHNIHPTAEMNCKTLSGGKPCYTVSFSVFNPI